MRVICVSDGDASTQDVFGHYIHIGEIKEVVNEELWPDGILCYEFAGLPDLWYDSRDFSPLSEIDETTFERNFKKELV